MPTGNWFDLRFGLSLCGDLCAATGHAAEALTLWAASAAADQHQRHDFPPWYVPRREEQMRQARQALGPGRARAVERGAAMSLATAAEYALMLTDPGPPQPAASGSGLLSARERELVTLVAQGRTDTQIAAQLLHQRPYGQLSPGHLRDKTGCRRRADLTRLALSAGLGEPPCSGTPRSACGWFHPRPPRAAQVNRYARPKARFRRLRQLVLNQPRPRP